METSPLSDVGRLLEQYAQSAYASRVGVGPDLKPKEPTIHVPNVGNGLLTAYEQLRVASENIEDHLLFQSAVKRFYARNLTFHNNQPPRDLASEMVIELTLAGYLKNNSITHPTLKQLDTLIAAEYAKYWEMLKPDDRIKREIVRKWVLESLAVKTEQLFNNPSELLAFASFAYQHYSRQIDVKDFVAEDEKLSEPEYWVVLYIAIHKSLLGSNDANVRNALFEMSADSINGGADLVRFNINYDRLSGLKTTAKISQAIVRHGAPLRILRTTFFNQSEQPERLQLDDKSATLELFSRKVDEEYGRLGRNLKAGIIKSIIFLLITKALIGILIEIPYDLYVTGEIAWLPLTVNLLFPPLFIAITGLTIKIPSSENKQAIISYLAGLLYEPMSALSRIRPPRRQPKARVFNLLYLAIFLLVFCLVAWGLAWLGFNMVQGVIFFIFLCTASFLGYRLQQQVKEYEIVPSSEGFLGLLRDTIYAPFVVVGRRISYRFARLNIVAQILDNVIELPLTTVLRLLRQWTAFLRNKTEES